MTWDSDYSEKTAPARARARQEAKDIRERHGLDRARTLPKSARNALTSDRESGQFKRRGIALDNLLRQKLGLELIPVPGQRRKPAQQNSDVRVGKTNPRAGATYISKGKP